MDDPNDPNIPGGEKHKPEPTSEEGGAKRGFSMKVFGRRFEISALKAWVLSFAKQIPERASGFTRVVRAAAGKMDRRRWILAGAAAVLLAAGAGAAGWFFMSRGPGEAEKKKQAEEQAERERDAARVAVKAFKAARYNYEDSLNALGNIKGAVEFKLSFEIPGVINSINYREGERYEEGALLLSLRQDDILLRLKRAQAELKKSETALSLAEGKLKDHERLHALGGISKAALEKVQSERDSSRYDVEVASLEVKASESVLEKSNLYAPSDGMVGQLLVEEGEAVTPNTLVGTHVQTNYVNAEFGVVERDMTKIQLGQKARVFVDAYPDQSFEGSLENIAPIVAGTSRTATVRARIENPDGVLLPGMFARIRILLYSKANALVVPTESLQGEEEAPEVWVVDPASNTVTKRPLRVGYRRPDYAEVEAGLEEGELVVVSGIERLQEGSQVRILEKQEAEL